MSQDPTPGPATAGPTDRPPATEWRRLDRRMLLIHPLQTFVRLLPALLAVFIARVGTSGDSQWELLAVPVIVGYGALRWFTTRYRISDGQIELRRGILTKATTRARLDKVRTVDLTAQVHHRALGLAKVEISTGSASNDRLVLDSLGIDAARRLRAELLHRADPAISDGPPAAADTPPSAPLPADEELLRLDPTWVRYAPLTLTGLATAAAVLGFVMQGFMQLSPDRGLIEDGTRWLQRLAWWADLVLVLAAVSVLAVLAYVLTFWGFRLTRNRLGTLHIRRGLLTNRETSIDRSRVRGVEVGEPLGLRFAGAARLRAVSTGLATERGGGSDWLAPPSPSGAVTRVALDVVDDVDAVTGRLVPHGTAARRRRMTRALVPAVVACLAFVLARTLWDGFGGLAVTIPLVLIGALALGRDRYAGLGHLVTQHHLVARSGSFDRTRVVLDRDGIIGWKVSQSWFQRRAGVATLVATTAAGRQHYDIVDVTPERAYEVIGEITPDLVADLG